MKYIMFQTTDGAKLPVIFPESLIHIDVAKKLCRMEGVGLLMPISAGSVIIKDAKVGGKSESLGLGSQTLDTIRIIFGDTVQFLPDDMLVGVMTQGYTLTEKDAASGAHIVELKSPSLAKASSILGRALMPQPKKKKRGK